MSDADVVGIRRLNLADSREAISPLHRYLRSRVLDGTLRPGTKLSQSALARQLGISRTPLREVLRMLQEEGLVRIEHNQRTMVAPLDPAEFDQIYGVRIMLESLAISMTAERFGPVEYTDAMRIVTAMRARTAQGDVEGWLILLVQLQGILRGGAHEALRRQLVTLAERALRYVRVHELADPVGMLQPADDVNTAVVESLRDQDVRQAVTTLTEHMAGNARQVLRVIGPDHVPVAVSHALEFVTASVRGGTRLDATG